MIGLESDLELETEIGEPQVRIHDVGLTREVNSWLKVSDRLYRQA